jgi:photosystem II stability/assembly factor-like uncharacterized protein
MRYFSEWLVALFTLLILSGCEAPLQMDAVEKQLNQPIRRSDQFQMAGANDSAIVVVGNQGLVLTSTDQGQSWRRKQLAGWPELIGVTSCPDGSFAALAAEGQVWVSTNNGEEWMPHAIDSEEAPQAITCDPHNRIWVVGSFSSIFSSDDTGANWEFTSLDEDTILTNIQFVDEQTAYISGEFGTLLKTTDGGLTWVRLPDLADNFYPQAMRFEDPIAGWLVGLQGQILHTEDGGETWVVQQTDTLAPLFGIEKAGDELYAVGGEGTVLRQQGQQWIKLDHGQPIRVYLRAVLPVNKDKLLVAGQAGALYVLPVGAP